MQNRSMTRRGPYLLGSFLLAVAVPVLALPGASGAASFTRTELHHGVISVSAPGSRLAASQSSNWSGYNQGILDTQVPFSSISASWVVPTATQHTAGQAEASATWIGIGGGCLNSSCAATDSTLIQAGTEQDVSASGVASYDAWWEIIPAPELRSTMTVNPGDVIDCSISSSLPGLWTITLQDKTDGQGFTQTVPYASDESTAEWIEETPTLIGSSGASLAALPNLTTVQFQNATVNGANANLSPSQEVQLTDSSGNPLATPSAPLNGDEFNDCAWASTCAAP